LENHFSGKAEETIGRAEDDLGKSEEKISRAEDNLGLFLLPPGLKNHFSTQKILSLRLFSASFPRRNLAL